MVEALLKLGANPNYIEHDESALHIAVASNDEKMVGKLIEYGGNIDLKTQVTKKDLEQIADTRWDNSGYNMIRFFQRKHQEVKTTTDLHDQPVKKDILPTKTPK
jgi:ankyrin repeat protein